VDRIAPGVAEIGPGAVLGKKSLAEWHNRCYNYKNYHKACSSVFSQRGGNPPLKLKENAGSHRKMKNILQIMAARSESNDRFQALPMAEMVRDSKRGDIISAPLAWDRIFREERNNAATYVRQSTAQWENEYRALLQAIKVPIILFWFSPKRLDEPVDFGAADTRAFLGKFPQFITGRNVDALRPFQGRFITCFSDRNMGQPLVSRFTGQPVEIDYGLLRGLGVTTKEKNNNYYPSSDMHIDAAQALFPAVREILG